MLCENLPLCGEYPEFLDICELRRRVSEGGCLGGSGAGLFGVWSVESYSCEKEGKKRNCHFVIIHNFVTNVSLNK